MTLDSTFERWTGVKYKGRRSPITELKVREAWFFDMPMANVKRMVSHQTKKYGKEFEFMTIKNGVVLRRCK